MPLGLEDERINSGALRASSSYNYNHGPERARLNHARSHGRIGAWVARYRNRNQWLQIKLPWLARVKGIATQGRQDASQWVTRYRVTYSVLGIRFSAYKELGKFKVKYDSRYCVRYGRKTGSHFMLQWAQFLHDNSPSPSCPHL